MFCDQTHVKFIAGKGGDGCVSFRREKYVARGGPDGANGGQGGNIVLRVDDRINTLSEFHLKKQFSADSGRPGMGKRKNGRAAEDLILPVPLGTMVFEEDMLIADLANAGDEYTVVRGGIGGKGNANFVSPTRQAPNFAELGEPGQQIEIRLELRLVADVGLIGLPSVGKSTIISRISNARPKIADYHFTTLIPNLGVVNLKEFGGDVSQNFIAADIPGLIEGASQGKGLGHEFLRHVLRTTVLVHVLDATHDDVVSEYKTIRKELRSYSKSLGDDGQNRVELVALNKIDATIPEIVDEHVKLLKKARIKNVYPISAVAGMGLKELMHDVYKLVEEHKQNAPAHLDTDSNETYKVFRPHEEDPRHFVVDKTKEGFVVHGPKIERIAIMTDFSNVEARNRVYDVMEKLGIYREISRKGAAPGDMIFIGENQLPYRG